jgi:hypothetical protein
MPVYGDDEVNRKIDEAVALLNALAEMLDANSKHARQRGAFGCALADREAGCFVKSAARLVDAARPNNAGRAK